MTLYIITQTEYVKERGRKYADIWIADVFIDEQKKANRRMNFLIKKNLQYQYSLHVVPMRKK